MTLCDYAINKGMDIKQYEILKSNISNIADAIIQNIKNIRKIDTGVYYPINEILTISDDGNDLVPFIIIALKKKGVEFYDNNTLYRY